MFIKIISELSMYAFILEMVLEQEGWDASQIEKLRKHFCPNNHGLIEVGYSTIYDEIKKDIYEKLEELETEESTEA